MSGDKMADKWSKHGADKLFGRRIVHVRYMGETEAEDQGFHHRPIVIHLDNGTLIYPSRDDEGNDGGALFGNTQDGATQKDVDAGDAQTIGGPVGLTFPVI
jgi:hypothetical protein